VLSGISWALIVGPVPAVIIYLLDATAWLFVVADRFGAELTFSGSTRFLSDRVISVDVTGELRGPDVVTLQAMIFD